MEIQNQCAEIKLRAERRAGEILKEMELKAGNPLWLPEETIVTPKLSDLGISKKDSSHWQLEATVPEEKFVEFATTVSRMPGTGRGTITWGRNSQLFGSKSCEKEGNNFLARAGQKVLTT